MSHNGRDKERINSKQWTFWFHTLYDDSTHSHSCHSWMFYCNFLCPLQKKRRLCLSSFLKGNISKRFDRSEILRFHCLIKLNTPMHITKPSSRYSIVTRAIYIPCIEHLRMLRLSRESNPEPPSLDCRRTFYAKSHSNGILVAIRKLSLCCYNSMKTLTQNRMWPWKQ